MPLGIGLPEILIVLVIVLVVFGPKRLPDLGRSLGSGMREFAAIRARCAGVRFSAPASESNVLATDVSAGASAFSACACSCWKRAACSSGSLLDALGSWSFCVSRTGFVTTSRIASFCQKQKVKATTSVAAAISRRRRSSER